MIIRYGRYVAIDPKSEDAVIRCGLSAFPYNQSQSSELKNWYGNRLLGNKTFVGHRFYLQPNENMRPPRAFGDPKPVKNPRPFFNDDLGTARTQTPLTFEEAQRLIAESDIQRSILDRRLDLNNELDIPNPAPPITEEA